MSAPDERLPDDEKLEQEEPLEESGELLIAADSQEGGDPCDPQEKERFYSRLAAIPGVRTMPSIGDWILIKVSQPADLARKVNRRLAPGVVSVPRNVPGTVRIHVADPKSNELLFRTIRDLVA